MDILIIRRIIILEKCRNHHWCRHATKLAKNNKTKWRRDIKRERNISTSPLPLSPHSVRPLVALPHCALLIIIYITCMNYGVHGLTPPAPPPPPPPFTLTQSRCSDISSSPLFTWPDCCHRQAAPSSSSYPYYEATLPRLFHSFNRFSLIIHYYYHDYRRLFLLAPDCFLFK